MLLGYARCSTVGQDLTTQRAKLASLGVEEKHIWTDQGFTGKTMTRDGLENVLKSVRAGDTLVVPSMDRLARNARETLRVVDELTAENVTLNIGGELYQPDSQMSRLFLIVLAGVAEAEGGWISARTKEAMARSDVRHKLKGKQPRMGAKTDANIAWHHAQDTMTVAALADLYNTSRALIYRAIARHRARTGEANATADAPDGMR